MPAMMMSDTPLPIPRLGDLFADPHQEQGAADKADGPGDLEQEAGHDHRLDALADRLRFQARAPRACPEQA
jgi:hypothetical protein